MARRRKQTSAEVGLAQGLLTQGAVQAPDDPSGVLEDLIKCKRAPKALRERAKGALVWHNQVYAEREKLEEEQEERAYDLNALKEWQADLDKNATHSIHCILVELGLKEQSDWEDTIYQMTLGKLWEQNRPD